MPNRTQVDYICQRASISRGMYNSEFIQQSVRRNGRGIYLPQPAGIMSRHGSPCIAAGKNYRGRWHQPNITPKFRQSKMTTQMTIELISRNNRFLYFNPHVTASNSCTSLQRPRRSERYTTRPADCPVHGLSHFKRGTISLRQTAQ